MLNHAHHPGSDVGFFGRRRRLGNGICMDALGNRADDVQAAPQQRRLGLRGRAGSGSRENDPTAQVRGQPWGRAPIGEAKKQGRRRSIPSTTLPAPDIEIGSRHPVNLSLPRNRAAMCEAVHNWRKKGNVPRASTDRTRHHPASCYLDQVSRSTCRVCGVRFWPAALLSRIGC